MFFIAWGWRARTEQVGAGHFHCPNEGRDRQYQLVAARKWFTLFWIPIVPMESLGEYVECTSCSATYDPSVRDLMTRGEMEDNLTSALRHIVVDMIRADGVIDDDERLVAVEIVTRFGNHPYTAADLERDLVELDWLGDAAYGLSGLLNDQGKESVIRACMELAAANGHVAQSEVRSIEGVGRDMGMSPAHVRGILMEQSEVDAAS